MALARGLEFKAFMEMLTGHKGDKSWQDVKVKKAQFDKSRVPGTSSGGFRGACWGCGEKGYTCSWCPRGQRTCSLDQVWQHTCRDCGKSGHKTND